MNTTQLLNDIEKLPPEAQHQIEAFIAFIKMRYQAVESKRQPETAQGDKTLILPLCLGYGPSSLEI